MEKNSKIYVAGLTCNTAIIIEGTREKKDISVVQQHRVCIYITVPVLSVKECARIDIRLGHIILP